MPTLKDRAAVWLRPAPAPAEIKPATRIVARVKRISLLDMDSFSLPFLRGQQSAQALFQWNFRFPAEDLPGARDVGLAHLRVVDREGFEHDLALDVLERSGVEVVEAAGAMAPLEQAIEEVRAEKTRTTGDDGDGHQIQVTAALPDSWLI